MLPGTTLGHTRRIAQRTRRTKREEGQSVPLLAVSLCIRSMAPTDCLDSAFAPIPIPQCNRYAPEQFLGLFPFADLQPPSFFVSCFPWATQATRLLLKPNSLNLDRRTNVAREMRGVGNKDKKAKKEAQMTKKKKSPSSKRTNLG